MTILLDEVIARIVEFRDQRNWAQFHNAKDLALGLSPACDSMCYKEVVS